MFGGGCVSRVFAVKSGADLQLACPSVQNRHKGEDHHNGRNGIAYPGVESGSEGGRQGRIKHAVAAERQ